MQTDAHVSPNWITGLGVQVTIALFACRSAILVDSRNIGITIMREFHLDGKEWKKKLFGVDAV